MTTSKSSTKKTHGLCALFCSSFFLLLRALKDPDFGLWMSRVVRKMAMDPRPEIQLCLLPKKAGGHGWLQYFRIGSPLHDDNGEVFAELLKSLWSVEGHQKEVMANLAGLLDSCLTVARQGKYVPLEVSLPVLVYCQYHSICHLV